MEDWERKSHGGGREAGRGDARRGLAWCGVAAGFGAALKEREGWRQPGR
jgi:hypothetical protein